MKKSLFMAALVAAVATGVWFGFSSDSNSGLTPAQLANLNALTDGEAVSSQYKCYTSFEYKLGSSVVDCTTCTTREDYTDTWYNTHDWCKR